MPVTKATKEMLALPPGAQLRTRLPNGLALIASIEGEELHVSLSYPNCLPSWDDLKAGYTAGQGKPVIILLDNSFEPELMYKMAWRCVTTIMGVVEAVARIRRARMYEGDIGVWMFEADETFWVAAETSEQALAYLSSIIPRGSESDFGECTQVPDLDEKFLDDINTPENGGYLKISCREIIQEVHTFPAVIASSDAY